MKNKGFSLIEMIVCLAIMAVALTVGGISLNYIRNARVKECAEELNSSIGLTRTAAMAHSGSTYLTVYRKDDGIYTYKSWLDKEEKIGAASISVSFSYWTAESGAEQQRNVTLGTQASGDILRFEFAKGSGSMTVPAVSKELLTINISYGKSYTITAYPLTGKTTLE